MKNLYRIAIAFMLLLSMLCSSSYAEEPYVVFKDLKTELNSGIGIKAVNERLIATDVTNTKTDKIMFGKEVLIARKIGKSGSIYSPTWCGNSALLFKGNKIGVIRVDLKTKDIIQISTDKEVWPMNCTPDGSWVVYSKDPWRPVRNSKEVAVEDGRVEEPAMERITELYKYEVASGKSYKFAEVRGSVITNVISPDGKKIFITTKDHVLFEVPGPKWEAVWFSYDEWSIGRFTTVWFPDSSGVATFNTGPVGIGVEFFGADHWAVPYKLKAQEYGENFGTLGVDGKSRLYFYAANDFFPDSNINTMLYRCTIKNKELSCEKVFEYDEIGSYEVLPGGDIIFNRIYADKCIRRVSPGHTGADCVLDISHNDNLYREIRLLGLSPDRRLITFTRSFWDFQDDLFTVELIQE